MQEVQVKKEGRGLSSKSGCSATWGGCLMLLIASGRKHTRVRLCNVEV